MRITDKKNKWTTAGNVPDGEFRVSYAFGNDTLLAGQTYRQLITHETCHPYILTSWCAGPGYFAFMREDTSTGLVYYRKPGSTENLLFDYNLVPGDSITFFNAGHTFVDTVQRLDSIPINGIAHKVWTMANKGLYPNRKYWVIEGIGCTNGLMFPTFFDGIFFEFNEQMICFSRDSVNTVFKAPYLTWTGHADSVYNYSPCHILSVPEIEQRPLTVTITPNPLSDLLTIFVAPGKITAITVTICSIDGRTLIQSDYKRNNTIIDVSGWPSGIYIVTVSSPDTAPHRQQVSVVH